MTSVRYRLNDLWCPIGDEIFFGDLLARSPKKPPVKVKENDDHYAIQIVAPGLKKEDFEIKFENESVSVQFARNEEHVGVFNNESFFRSWGVPQGTKPENIVARYDAGILSVLVGKVEKTKPKAYSIEIQ